jgi:hypothetical protein
VAGCATRNKKWKRWVTKMLKTFSTRTHIHPYFYLSACNPVPGIAQPRLNQSGQLYFGLTKKA